MEFFEFVLALGIVVVLPIYLAKMIIDYKREKRLSARPPDNSIGVSELKSMIRETLSEETAEIKDRIEWLEDKLELNSGKQIQAHPGQGLLHQYKDDEIAAAEEGERVSPRMKNA